MAGSVDVIVRFIADSKSVQTETAKVEGSGNKLKGWAKGVGAAIGGAFAVKEIGSWISAAEEANAASATLAKTLANAGDETGAWAKHAEDLSGNLMRQTGIDDEVIKGAQSILATFHGVGGAVGQTSGAFDRATGAALDLAKTGFGDADSAATMLGKALEDPEKGLTALGRAGVTFSADQKKAIKAMVESGDKAGAMALILDNVEGQVGGVAAASATAGDKMKVAFGETKESLGNALLPAMEALAPILQTVAGFIQENAGWLVPLAAAFAGVTIAVWLFNAALAANPIVQVALGVALLIAAIVLLWQNWDQVWTWITDAVAWAVSFVLDHWQMIIGAIFPMLGVLLLLWNNWDKIWTWITDLLGKAVGWIGDQIGKLIGFFASIPGRIGSALAGLGEIIKAPFQWAWDQIVSIKDGIVSAFTGAIDLVKDLWNRFATFWNGVEVDIPSVDIGPVSIGGGTFGLPDLPTFAKGGIVTQPTLAVVGEVPEAIVPLSKMGAAARTGPVVVIENATFTDPVDVDLFMRRAAWSARAAGL